MGQEGPKSWERSQNGGFLGFDKNLIHSCVPFYLKMKVLMVFSLSFFLSMLSFMATYDTREHRKGEDHLCSSQPVPFTHKHSNIYLQFCMWDGHHISLTLLIITRLLLCDSNHFWKVLYEIFQIYLMISG